MQARSRLVQRRAEKPATKAGQIRALWPEIEAALAIGQSMKTICEWLAEDAAITLSVNSLTSYVSRIRRRQSAVRSAFPSATSASKSDPLVSPLVPTPTSVTQSLTLSGANPTAPRDPLANVRASLAKRPGSEYHPATEDDIKGLV
jgi:hypothetical protein